MVKGLTEPSRLLRMRDGEKPARKVLALFGAAVMVALLSVWFPWSYVAGVCVEGSRIGVTGLSGRKQILETADLVEARRQRSSSDEGLSLSTRSQHLYLPLKRRLGMGGVEDPTRLGAALQQLIDRAGLREKRERLQSPEELKELLVGGVTDGGTGASRSDR